MNLDRNTIIASDRFQNIIVIDLEILMSNFNFLMIV